MGINIALNATANATSPSYDGKYLAGNRPALRTFTHGDSFTIAGNFGDKLSTRSFLGGATGPWEVTAVGATPANITNWAFDYTAGGPITVKNDPIRGKVLFGVLDGSNINAAIRYQIPGGIPENRRVFATHVTKGNLRMDGARYTLQHQTKHFRFNHNNSVSDTNPDAKWHTWEQQGSSLITTADGVGSTLTSGFPPNNDNIWYRMELFYNPGTQGNTDGKIVARIHHNGQTTIIHNDQTYGGYGSALRHTSYVEQYYYGNFNGRVKNGEFTVGTVANNYTYRIAATGWSATYISSANANEMEILLGIRDAVLNHTNKDRTAYIVGNKVIVGPANPNDILAAFFYNDGGSAYSIIGNPSIAGPYASTRETMRDDNCIYAGSTPTDGWERIELRSAIDEANSLYREQQLLDTWTVGAGISGSINVGGLPKGRHELYLCAISDIDAAGKDIIAYSELVAIVVN